MAEKQTANPTSFYKLKANKVISSFSEESYHATMHYSLLLSPEKKKAQIALDYFILFFGWSKPDMRGVLAPPQN